MSTHTTEPSLCLYLSSTIPVVLLSRWQGGKEVTYGTAQGRQTGSIVLHLATYCHRRIKNLPPSRLCPLVVVWNQRRNLTVPPL